MPKVCIVVPCFNQGLWVKDTIDSALAQTFEDFEIILVNDGSTDPVTNRICKELSHSKLRLIETENQGLAEARNTAIRATEAQYILPLDSDDRILPNYLEQTVRVLDERPEVGIVYTDVELFGEEQGIWNVEPYSFPEILTSPQIVASSLFRKKHWESAGGYQKDMIYGWEDYDFWLSVIKLGAEVHKIPEPLFHYRRTAGSMAGLDRQKMVYSFKKLFEHHKELYEANIGAIFDAIVDARPHRNQITSRDTFEIHLPKRGHESGSDIRSQHYAIGCWLKIEFLFDAALVDNQKPIRLDLGMRTAIYEIASIQLLRESDQSITFRANGADQLDAIIAGGTAIRLEHETNFRILGTGEDPYIYLPAGLLPLEPIGPTRISIWFQQHKDLSALKDGIAIKSTDDELKSKIVDLEEKARFQSEQEGLLRFQMCGVREQAQTLRNERSEFVAQIHEQQATLKSMQAELFNLQAEVRRLTEENQSLRDRAN
jgi:glycosyltransferase involved in cell wall biosynthesis